MGRISFFLKEALGSLRRNYFMTIAALVTVFLSIVVLGGVLVFSFTADALLQEFEQKVQVTVYLTKASEATPDTVTKLQTEINTWSEVKSVKFVSAADALAIMKQKYSKYPEMWQAVRGNPFPASFQITLKDPKTAEAVAAKFKGNPIVDEVKYGEEYAKQLFRVISNAEKFLIIFIALLGIVAVLLISNTIRLSIFARKREVEIMKLVGATNWFIRWPFLIEGVFVGLVGAVVATAVVLVVNNLLVNWLQNSLPFMSIPLNAVPYAAVIGILVAVGIVIGAVGSGLGLRRFLKV